MERKEDKEVIEIICVDMMCFEVDAKTLDPLGTSYYEPAAWTDTQGRKQISDGYYQKLISEGRIKK